MNVMEIISTYLLVHFSSQVSGILFICIDGNVEIFVSEFLNRKKLKSYWPIKDMYKIPSGKTTVAEFLASGYRLILLLAVVVVVVVVDVVVLLGVAVGLNQFC